MQLIHTILCHIIVLSQKSQFVSSLKTLERTDIIVLTTLRELVPETHLNFVVEEGQILMYLSWDSVQGYDNIGGAAVSYNIYRIPLNHFVDQSSLALYANSNTNSDTDYNLDDNAFYCYAVSGVNSEGAEGDKYSVVCNGTL